MSIWVTVPSARPAAEVVSWALIWRALGYKVAVVRDVIDLPPLPVDYVIHSMSQWGKYPGYAVAVNTLIRQVQIVDPAAEWFVIGGDDIKPDQNKSAQAIAEECLGHFIFNGIMNPVLFEACVGPAEASTLGVMQPTGDRWGENERHGGKTGSAYIDRVSGSAWLGREFCRRAYAGKGPLFEGYQHMFVDEELQAVAEKLGVFLQRRDLTQYHNHWGRARARAEDMPEFLGKWNTPTHWRESKALFEERRDAGFPGHEMLGPAMSPLDNPPELRVSLVEEIGTLLARKEPAAARPPTKAATGSAVNARAIGDEEVSG